MDNHLLENFYDSNILTDYVLKIKDSEKTIELDCHKLVLSLFSEKISKMIENNENELIVCDALICKQIIEELYNKKFTYTNFELFKKIQILHELARKPNINEILNNIELKSDEEFKEYIKLITNLYNLDYLTVNNITKHLDFTNNYCLNKKIKDLIVNKHSNELLYISKDKKLKINYIEQNHELYDDCENISVSLDGEFILISQNNKIVILRNFYTKIDEIENYTFDEVHWLGNSYAFIFLYNDVYYYYNIFSKELKELDISGSQIMANKKYIVYLDENIVFLLNPLSDDTVELAHDVKSILWVDDDFVALYKDNQVQLYDENGFVKSIVEMESVDDIIWKKDNCYLLLMKNDELYIYNIITEKEEFISETDDYEPVCSNDGRFISYVLNNTAYIYDLVKKKETKTQYNYIFEWSDDNKYMVVESCDDNLIVDNNGNIICNVGKQFAWRNNKWLDFILE